MPKSNPIETRDRYPLFSRITTRWKDNDIHGHINNAVYNDWMDTTVSNFFRRQLPSDNSDTPFIPETAEVQITFKRPITHPADVEAGFRIDRIDNGSVVSGVGIFLRGESEAAAWGQVVHRWIDRESSTPVSIPDAIRKSLELATTRSSH